MEWDELIKLAFKHGIGWYVDGYGDGWHVVRWDNPDDDLYVDCIEESLRDTIEFAALKTAILVLVNQAENE